MALPVAENLMMNAPQNEGCTTRRRLMVGLVGGVLTGLFASRTVHAERGQGEEHRAHPETGLPPTHVLPNVAKEKPSRGEIISGH